MKANNMLGVINIRKEKGYTSHDVVAIIRKITGAKTGHTGTLDPNAEGVLPICLGRATKLADYIAAEDKNYIAELVLGITTTTADIWGETLTTHPPGRVSETDFSKIKAVAESFIGEILQTPPMYSAIKIGGKKLYELARKGQTIERPPRKVVIHSLNATQSEGKILLDVLCSKGTYIRSLCADIGDALGCGAAMGGLIRTRSGAFSIDDSVTLDEVRMLAENGKLAEIVLPVEKVLPYPAYAVKQEELSRVLNGGKVDCEEAPALCWLYSPPPESKLIGLYAREGDTLRLRVMLWS